MNLHPIHMLQTYQPFNNLYLTECGKYVRAIEATAKPENMTCPKCKERMEQYERNEV